MYTWSTAWQLPIAASKCSVFAFGTSVHADNFQYFMGDVELEVVDSIRDLGFEICRDQKFSKHCLSKSKDAFSRTGLIYRSFKTRELDFLLDMYLTYVRPIVEFGTVVWSPHLLKDIDLVENVQRRYTKRIPGLSHLSYPQRLNILSLDSLEYRRLIFDLEMTFNIIKNNSPLKFDDFFRFAPATSTRSNSLRPPG